MGLSRVIDSVNVCGMLLRNRKHLQDLQLKTAINVVYDKRSIN